MSCVLLVFSQRCRVTGEVRGDAITTEEGREEKNGGTVAEQLQEASVQTRVSASRHSTRSSLGVGAALSQSPSSVGNARPLCLGILPRLLFWIRGWHPRNTSEDGELQLFSNKCNVI